jgi:predicted Zn-dependent protease
MLIKASALLETDPAAALRIAAQILEDSPHNSAAALLLANASRSVGDSAAAYRLLESLAKSQPNSAVVQLELARACRAVGNSNETLDALRRAVDLAPNLADAWRELSNQLAAGSDTRGADAAFGHYLDVMSEDPALIEPATRIGEGRFAVAEGLLRRLLQTSPDNVFAMRMLASSLARHEAYPEAEQWLRECLRQAPGFSAARFDLAQLLMTQQKPALLAPLIERLLALDPLNSDYRNLQAAYLSFISQHDRSIDILESLVSQSPEKPAGWITYGHELKAAGRQTASIEAYRRAIALAPSSGAAYWSLANLKTFRFSDNDLDAMRAALMRSDLRQDDRVTLEFALGKALEDASQFAESFEHYSAGNALRREGLSYDPAWRSTHIKDSKNILTKEFFAARAGWGSNSRDPIFVLGLPRSGSTLLEQILASHSEVEGTRELPNIIAAAAEIGSASSEMNSLAYVRTLENLDAARVADLAQRYLDETAVYRLAGRARFVDKMPNNFLHIGLIHLMFPEAPIIDARRNPMACCFSCFKQYFGMGQVFTYDLAWLGNFYQDYEELMDHVDTVLPGRVHRVHYEKVVASLEVTIRDLLAYCKLPFEPQCLRYYENPRVVQTASSEQVRRPIFSESLDQWRHFEPWLKPLKDALGGLAERYP